MTSHDKNGRAPSAPAGASFTWTGVYAAGLVALFVGERLIGAGTGRTVASGAGLLATLLALAVRLVRAGRAGGERRSIENLLGALKALGLGGVLLYFLQSDLLRKVAGKTLEASSPKLAVVVAALYPALLLGALLPLLLVEMSYASMRLAPRVEVGRVRDAMLSGIGLAGVLVFAFSAYYVASERNKKADFSYFRTTRPGEATRNVVRSLDQPVDVAFFFPPANEVREEVRRYLEDLGRESKLLQVAGYDHAVDPARAKELGVSGNGIVVVARGGRREQLSLSTELESARTQLKNLDKEIQKRLLAIARPGRTVYLSTGHGERTADPTSDTDKRSTLRSIRQLLLDQSYAVKDLGAAEGLAAEVPSDAAAVMVIGPARAFLAEEVASLERYLDRGGHLFVALDPEANLDFKELLAPLGVSFSPTPLAHETLIARKTYQASDRGNLATGSFSSHPSVSTLGKLRPPVILPGVGSLVESKEKPAGVTIDFTVHAPAGTWADANGNFQFDQGEARKSFEVAAAVTRRAPDRPGDKPGDKPGEKKDAAKDAKPKATEGRAVVVADSDALSDAAIGVYGNPYLVLDGLKWLLGEEALAGETASEQDVPIAHTRNQDMVWFYSTIFLAPALVLGMGWLAARRRRRGSKRSAGAPPSPPGPTGASTEVVS